MSFSKARKEHSLALHVMNHPPGRKKVQTNHWLTHFFRCRDDGYTLFGRCCCGAELYTTEWQLTQNDVDVDYLLKELK